MNSKNNPEQQKKCTTPRSQWHTRLLSSPLGAPLHTEEIAKAGGAQAGEKRWTTMQTTSKNKRKYFNRLETV